MKLPKQFVETITKTWGEPGRLWIKTLPDLISRLCIQWKLSSINPFENLTYNYVARAYSAIHQSPVVLKIGFPSHEFIGEIKALEYYAGNGCVKLLDQDTQHGGMLLALIQPGTTLTTFFPEHDGQATNHAAHVMQKLHKHHPAPTYSFSTIRSCFALFDSLEVPEELKIHVAKARILANELLASDEKQYVLHGDLHHDNILLDESNSWIAIDPKGIVGELAFEVGAFMCNQSQLLLQQPNPQAITARRLDQFSQILNIDRQRLANACYARIILSACWSIQDGTDWQSNIRCAELIY